MRYKYRVRLFYSILFLIIGLVLGYSLAGYNTALKNIGNQILNYNYEKPLQQKDITETVSPSNLIGTILPISEASITDAIDLAVLRLNSENERKINITYETAGCSIDAFKKAISKLKSKNVVYVYSVVCEENLDYAINIANEKNMILLVPIANQELADKTSAGIIKISIYPNLAQEMNSFFTAYKMLYKRPASTSDALSYDAINLISQMMNKIEIKEHKGALGVINLERKDNSYVLLLTI